MISQKICTIKNLLNFLKNKTVITLEKRDKLKYRTYGVMNQGEFSEYLNPANNKTWKVIIPGYEERFKEKNIIFKSIIGIFWLSNGNHKIFTHVDNNDFDKSRCLLDIKKYIDEYLNIHTNLKGWWIEPIII